MTKNPNRRILEIDTKDLRQRLKKAGFLTVNHLSKVENVSWKTAKNIFCNPTARLSGRTLKALKRALEVGYIKEAPSVFSFDTALEMTENPHQFN